jgi:hypothetical protein
MLDDPFLNKWYYCPLPPQSGARDMEMPGVRPSKICCKRSKIFICWLSHSSGRKSSNINFRWNCSTLKFWCVFADILKMATILTICFRILPNFELKLEIPNIMLVCKFEINWSTNKNLRAAKMHKISKCSNFNENGYVGFFPHEECDSDKSNLKIASYFCNGTQWCTNKNVDTFTMSVPDEDYSRNVLCALN